MRALSTLAASTTLVLAIALLGSCTEFDIFLEAAMEEGTVYECKMESGRIVEYCYFDDSSDELATYIGGTCGDPTRRWPRFVNFFNMGCNYSCPHPGKGCNAKQGCYCPGGKYPTD